MEKIHFKQRNKNQFEDESKVFDKIKKNITKKMIDDVIKRWKNEI